MRKDGNNEFQALFIAGPNAQVVLKKSAQTLLPLVLQLVATLPTEVADVCTGFTGMHAKVAKFVKKLVEFEHLNVFVNRVFLSWILTASIAKSRFEMWMVFMINCDNCFTTFIQND